jgi:hypothetical protein
MPEADYNKLIKHMERLLDQKEFITATSVQELVQKLHVVQGDIIQLQMDMKDLSVSVDKAVMSLSYKNDTHERRLSLIEKMVLGTAATILLAVIGALVASVLN